MINEEIISQWHSRGEIPTQKMIDEHGLATVWAYMRQCAERISRATPIDENGEGDWDDPEEWQIEAVVVAHGVSLMNGLEKTLAAFGD
jgi:hypothetical protein